MSDNVPPSRDPANDDSLVGFTKELKRFLFKNIDKATPAMVLSHDRAANRVKVKPLITMVDSNGDAVSKSNIASVPVLNLGGGGWLINFNLPAGQQGMIFSFDRDISLFLQAKAESRPNTSRMHTFEDSIFIPQQWFDYVISEEDSAAMVIQNLNGTAKVALDDSSIRIVHNETRAEFTSDSTSIDSPLSINLNSAGGINITSDGGVTVNNVTFDSSGAVNSPASVTAPMLAGTTDVTFGGKSGVGHAHSGGTLPSGNTGAPV